MSTKKAKSLGRYLGGVALDITKGVEWSFQDISVRVIAMEVKMDSNTNKYSWASVSISDGMIYEGTIEAEMPYGLYLHIGGNMDRLSLFPWHMITRVVYKSNI